jgi:hypothetical protein
MTRRTWAAALFVGLAGCLDHELSGPTLRNKAVEVPRLPEASLAAAARVDQVGRQLLGQNPFLGVEPTFHTYGQAEPEVFHPDLNGVFITEGLVQRCKSDEELAAVLALELAKMSAERRTAERLRNNPGPLPTLPDVAAVSPGGIGSDQNQLGTQALFDRKLSSPGKPAPPDDPQAAAAEILRAAGFDPKVLEHVAPLVQEAGRNHAASDGLGGRPVRPLWSN